MKIKSILLILITLPIWIAGSSSRFAGSSAKGYGVGDLVENFTLKNVDGKLVSLEDYKNSKGVIVVFTCNHCPYAKAYESRIMDLDKNYRSKGYPVLAINPNDPSIVSDDSYEKMQELAKEKGYTFPYLIDEKQDVFPKFGATKTPHVFLLHHTAEGFMVKYIGAIDDNYEDAASVKNRFVENAIQAIETNQNPDPSVTKAIGCSIKVAKK